MKSGEPIAPRIPDPAEHPSMQDRVTTYGKTWHTSQLDRSANFPLGLSQLMMCFTRDGLIDTPLLEDRDRRFDTSTADARREACRYRRAAGRQRCERNGKR